MTSLTRFNKIAIQATADMAADKEAVGLSRVHVHIKSAHVRVYNMLTIPDRNPKWCRLFLANELATLLPYLQFNLFSTITS